MEWYNKPSDWKIEGNEIIVTARENTDFWRKTEYGYICDNGHFYYQPVKGNFCVEVNVKGEYKEQYDQAGLMVRLNETHWLKCGIELIDGVKHFITVMTKDYSDVSLIPISEDNDWIGMRILRRKDVLDVFYSFDLSHYTPFRKTHFTSAETTDVGIMCASPTKGNFTTIFKEFNLNH